MVWATVDTCCAESKRVRPVVAQTDEPGSPSVANWGMLTKQ